MAGILLFLAHLSAVQCLCQIETEGKSEIKNLQGFCTSMDRFMSVILIVSIYD